MTELTVIYVNYYSREELNNSMASLASFTSIPYEVIVVNNSPDEDLSSLESQYENLEVIDAPQNLGFGKACNTGIKAAKTDYVLLLNPDTYFEEDTISKCLEAYKKLDSESTGLLTCKHLYEDGSFQYCSVPRSDLPVFPFIHVPWKRARFNSKQIFNESKKVIDLHESSHYTYAVHGSFLLAPRQLFLEESFDEDFFLYSEEIDICRRLNNVGKKSYFFSESYIVHSSHRASESIAIRNQMYLSSGLMVLKLHGKTGFTLYYAQRVIRGVLIWLIIPFLSKPVRGLLRTHLKDANPMSKDYLRIFRYGKRINSYKPLKSSKLS